MTARRDCDDFVAAMESVYVRQHPGDLSVFRRWYRQAGTPRVTVRLEHDAAAQRCTVTLSQECAPVGVEEGWRGLRQGAVPHPLRYRAA